MVLSPFAVLNFMLFFLVLILETYFTFFMSLKHDGDFSSIDIESKDGIVRRCNAKYTLPCYRINDDWGEVDIFTDHFDLFNSLTVDGIRGT